MKECKQCGTQFTSTHNTTKYCSDECRKAQKVINNRAWRATEKGQQCERTYREAGKRQAYMDVYFKTDKYKAYQQKYLAKSEVKARQRAYGEAYRASDAGKAYHKAYGKAYHQTPEGRAKTSRADAIRRMRMSDAFCEMVDRLVVMERDGWMCGLCGGEVDQGAVYPDPLFPSLDHIIPLSKGGEHSYKNVQCAHLRCNISKGNRV